MEGAFWTAQKGNEILCVPKRYTRDWQNDLYQVWNYFVPLNEVSPKSRPDGQSHFTCSVPFIIYAFKGYDLL